MRVRRTSDPTDPLSETPVIKAFVAAIAAAATIAIATIPAQAGSLAPLKSLDTGVTLSNELVHKTGRRNRRIVGGIVFGLAVADAIARSRLHSCLQLVIRDAIEFTTRPPKPPRPIDFRNRLLHHAADTPHHGELHNMPFETEFKIAWGDCDPAGIVFYPRYFYWFDTTYQRWLQANDLSQAILQARYGIVGTGVIDTAAAFRTPSRDGDSITVRASVTDWQERSFRVDYECRREDRTIAIGHETRGWFEITDQRIRRGTIPDEFRLALS